MARILKRGPICVQENLRSTHLLLAYIYRYVGSMNDETALNSSSFIYPLYSHFVKETTQSKKNNSSTGGNS
ncbi:hypothetical protein ACHAXS_001728 [Conticribra weissflogii]